jgi:hypothetical protein
MLTAAPYQQSETIPQAPAASSITQLTSTSGGALHTYISNGGSSGMLFPGTLAADYIITTAAKAVFTAGTKSYNAVFTQAIVSPNGGAIKVDWADGSNSTFTLMAGTIYPINITKVYLTGTAVTDLQIFV